MPNNPIGLKSDGNHTELDPVAVANTIADTTALAAYAGAVGVLLTADRRTWQKCTAVVTGGTTQLTNPAGKLFCFSTTSLDTKANNITLLKHVTWTGSNLVYWLHMPLNGHLDCRLFGGNWDGGNDDAPAIQAAVDWAKLVTAPFGGTYRLMPTLPVGPCHIRTTINCTNTNGLWVVGAGSGSYLGTMVTCNTSAADGTGMGIAFDFSGSTLSGLANMHLITDTAWGNITSKIGVLFALTDNGGLRCQCRNVSFDMADMPTANGGYGSIGYVNIRTEESTLQSDLIRANTGAIFSNQADLSALGFAYTITSPFVTLSTGVGSMGVVNLTARIITRERRNAALYLNGTNSFTVDSLYVGSELAPGNTTGSFKGSENRAIIMRQSQLGHVMSGTIEVYPTLVDCNNVLENCRIGFNSANLANPNAPAYIGTGAQIRGTHLSAVFANPGERPNATFLYHAPIDGGDTAATGGAMNSVFSCMQANNLNFVSANLLRNSDNCQFNSSQPFERQAGVIRTLFRNTLAAGNATTPTVATVMRFKQADKATTSSSNGGFYSISLSGIIRAGGYASGGASTLRFQASITIGQEANGSMNTADTSILILEKSETNAGYVSVTGLDLGLSFASGIGSVLLTPTATGASEGLTIYMGAVEITSDFKVNAPIPLA